MNKQEALSMLNCSMDSNLNLKTNDFVDGISTNAVANSANALYQSSTSDLTSGWGYYTNLYYPWVIKESYPVYLQERAADKGKQAFEIIKAMQDKKLMKLDTVADFVEAMDLLIKIL